MVGLATLAVVAPVACSRDGFEDRTATVQVDGSSTGYEVDACGLDGSTLFVVARSSGGSVLQAVVGLEDDGETGVPASTGLTVSDGDVDLAAFGAESWARRGEAGDPPGRITEARLRGSRIQVEGRVAPLDADGGVAVEGAALPFALDARCDERDDAPA